MKKNNLKIWVACLLIFTGTVVKGQNVSISEDELYTPDPAAMLEIYSPNKGLLIPRLALITTNNPISVTKPTGLMVWNTSSTGNYPSPGFYFWDGSDWKMVGATSFAFQNGITQSGSNIKLGGSLTENTTLTQGAFNMVYNLTSTGDFDIQDNGSSAFFVRDDGFVGIGTNSPLHKLHVYGDNSNVAGTDGMFIDIQNINNTTGVLSGIRFQNGTAATTFKGGIFYRDTLGAGRGDMLFANNTSGVAGNVNVSDAEMIISHKGNVGIGTRAPNTSALLEMASTSKGVLVPRMDSTQRVNISSPSNGLLVFDTGKNSFFYYNSVKAKWVNLSAVTPSATINDALFAVVNNKGDTVFAVYPEGVQINVGDGIAKGTTKGGFAVSGISTGKATKQDYFIINQDSARIYVEDAAKGEKGTTKGGFAVSGVSSGKGIGNDIFRVTEDSIRVYFNSAATKGTTKGGFAVSGVSSGKGTEQNYFLINQDSARIYVEDAAKGEKGTTKGGFAVSGVSSGKGISNDFMKVTKDSTRIFVADPNAGFSIGNTGSGTAQSLMKLTKQNYFIGHESGINTNPLLTLEYGKYNSFYGYQTGLANTSGYSNVFIGYLVGESNTSGHHNVFVGSNAATDNTLGYNNVMIGANAGKTNTEGFSNVFVGDRAGNFNTIGSNNVFLGNLSGFNNESGKKNIFIGYKAGYLNKNNNNIFIGDSVGYSNVNGKSNVFIGVSSGTSNIEGSDNIFLGNSAGSSSSAGHDNIFIGNESAKHSTTSAFNIFIGNKTGYNTTTGQYNTYIGFESGKATTTGEYNVYIGYQAGLLNETYFGNTFVGNEAGKENTAGGNTFIGMQAGKESGASASNTFVGYNAGQSATGNFNTFVGMSSGVICGVGTDNTYLGHWAGYNTPNSNNNVYVGKGAGQGYLGPNPGSNNVYVGKSAGTMATGSSNIFIGKDVGSSETGSNLLLIDNSSTTSPLIWGDFNANDFAINGDVYVNGVGAVAPFTGTTDFDVNGTTRLRGLLYDYSNSAGSAGNVLKRGASGIEWGNGALGTGTANSLAFWSDANTLSSNANLHWDNTNERLGIGTATPDYTFQVNNTGAKTVAYIGSYLYNAATSSTASITKTGLYINSTGAWSGISAVNRGLYVNVTGGTNNYAAIFDGGDVGIGTTGPTNKLHVLDNAALVTDNSYCGYFSSTAGATSGLAYGVRSYANSYGSSIAYAIYADATGGTTTGSEYAFYGLGDGYFSGNLGVGTTPSAYALDVRITAATATSTTYGGYFASTAGATSGSANGVRSIANAYGSSNAYAIYAIATGGTTTGSEYAFYGMGEGYFSGNVGIGTNAPSASLNIEATSTATAPHILIKDNAANGYGRMTIQNASGSKYWTMAGILNNTTDASSKLNFYYHNGTTGTDILSINGSGNVGIGLTAPEGLLHLNSNGDALSIIEADADNVTETDNPRLEFRQDGNSVVGGIGFEGTAEALYTNSLANAMYMVNDYASALQIGTSGTAHVTITSTGNVGIGITNPGYKLTVNGTAWCTANAWASDVRMKKNIETLNLNGPEILSKLRPVTYEWKEVTDDGMKGMQIGFIAQELEKVLPSMVITANDSIQSKSIKYSELIPVIVDALQDQQKQIEALKSENAELKTTQDNYEKLKAEIEKIKASIQME